MEFNWCPYSEGPTEVICALHQKHIGKNAFSKYDKQICGGKKQIKNYAYKSIL